MELVKATRSRSKLRIGLAGPSGSGKTMSALLLAYGITGDWNKIAVIDTENMSASLYADFKTENVEIGQFNTLPINPPYEPERYINAIMKCEEAGMECIVIDSITHEWSGQGGCLEILDKISDGAGGKYRGFANITPRHRAFIDSIIQSKRHIITTVRSKQDYNMITKDGKTVVEKVGTKQEIREGFEYELTTSFEIDYRHLASTSKDRTGMFSGVTPFTINKNTGKQFIDWFKVGKEIKPISTNNNDIEYLTAYLKQINNIDDIGSLKEYWSRNKDLHQTRIFVDAIVRRKEKIKLSEKIAKQKA